eukprot:CAMPEP_0172709460 /NCGR_PEP_ID=MMETSP1074-20121228/54715_1 /TAXON_ID=2916 /ORGANISM="Ceratium fusus, Strain PA161109" /LENGTH=87 /DNA_ID=CAMNT_0013532717 /DNA_START=58 /DNA_END=318 /DNA_ORIENTATION=+
MVALAKCIQKSWTFIFALLLCCTVADAAKKSCADSAGYSDCAMQKDISTVVSLGVGFMGSFLIAKLTGVHRQSGGVEANRGAFSVLW